METLAEPFSDDRERKAPVARASNPPTASRVAVATLFLINGALFGTWVSRIPTVQAERGISHGMLGLALLAMALGALVAMPLAGRWFAKLGSHRICQIFAVLYALGLPLLAVVPGFTLFVVALFIFGACHGGLDVAMNAQAVGVEKRYDRPIMSSFHALFSTGGLAGAAIGGIIAGQGIAPAVHFAGAAVLLLATGAVFAFPHLIDDRHVSPAHADLLERKRFSLPSKGLVALGAVAFSAMVGEGAMADWSGIFLRNTLRASEGLAAAGYAAFSIAMAVTRFAGDKLSTHLGATGLVRSSGFLAVGGMSLALAGPSPMAAMVGFAFVGIGFATVVPTVFSAAGRAAGISPGVALSTVSTVGYLGFLIGPPLIGFVAEWVGLRGALAIVLFTSGLIVLLAPFVRGERVEREPSRTGNSDVEIDEMAV